MTVALPDHCTPTERWLAVFSSAFHTCVPTNLAFLSTVLGTCSIISWLFAQMPQIYKNYKLKSASGLSIYFLAEWLLGDLTNLMGAVLTDQAAWQILVAAYYVTVDVCMVAQYVWYVHAKPWRKARLVEYGPHYDDHHDGPEPFLEGISPVGSNTSVPATQGTDKKDENVSNKPIAPAKGPASTQLASVTYNEKAPISIHQSFSPYHQPFPSSYPRVITLTTLICVALTTATPIHPLPSFLTLSSTPTPSPVSASTSRTLFAGRILSWTSTALYLLSRLPQIYKNALRRSTAGLSPTLFIAAFFGNLFYSTSLLANPLAWSSYPPYGLHGWVGGEGSDRWRWVGLAMPFWLGAAGVLVMDGVIGVQFLVYGEGVEVEVLDGEEEEDEAVGEDGRGGRGSWRAVKGWMRGWVPSPGPASRREVEAVRGEERPLMNPQRSEGDRRDGYGAA